MSLDRVRFLTPRLGLALAALGAAAGCTNDCPNCPGGVATVVVSPGSPGLLPGRTLQLTALPFDADGVLLAGRSVTWSSNSAAVTVDPDGIATGVSIGAATITATIEGKTGTGTVTVTSTPGFASQIFPILAASCGLAGCHVSPGPPPTMTSSGGAYAAIVTSGTRYVTPNDSTVGVLLARMKDAARPMPPGAPFATLERGNYDLIAVWIAQGAQSN